MPSETPHDSRLRALDVVLVLFLIGLSLPLVIFTLVEVTWMARFSVDDPIPDRIAGIYFLTALLSRVTAPAAVLLGALGSVLRIFTRKTRITSRIITIVVILAWIIAILSPP